MLGAGQRHDWVLWWYPERWTKPWYVGSAPCMTFTHCRTLLSQWGSDSRVSVPYMVGEGPSANDGQSVYSQCISEIDWLVFWILLLCCAYTFSFSLCLSCFCRTFIVSVWLTSYKTYSQNIFSGLPFTVTAHYVLIKIYLSIKQGSAHVAGWWAFGTNYRGCYEGQNWSKSVKQWRMLQLCTTVEWGNLSEAVGPIHSTHHKTNLLLPTSRKTQLLQGLIQFVVYVKAAFCWGSCAWNTRDLS